LLTSGDIPPIPSELLGSQRMKNLVLSLKEEFDYVIVDAPPSMVVTDPVILGSFLDGVVFVVRYGKTRRDVIVRLKQKFQEVGANMLGVILNGVNLKEERLHYGDPSYYHSYRKAHKSKKLSQISVPAGQD